MSRSFRYLLPLAAALLGLTVWVIGPRAVRAQVRVQALQYEFGSIGFTPEAETLRATLFRRGGAGPSTVRFLLLNPDGSLAADSGMLVLGAGETAVYDFNTDRLAAQPPDPIFPARRQVRLVAIAMGPASPLAEVAGVDPSPFVPAAELIDNATGRTTLAASHPPVPVAPQQPPEPVVPER